MKPPDVSILIVCYKSRELVAETLRTLYAHSGGFSFETLLVDNSNDGTVETVRRDFPQVRIIDNDANLGFAAGNNLLARHATGDYLLLLNPDTELRDNAIATLLEFARRQPIAGAWGGVTELPDGRVDPGCQQAAPTLRNTLLMTAGLARLACSVAPTSGEEKVMPTLSGAFMLVRRSSWQAVGGFDASFVLYAEELDLCHRLRRRFGPIRMTGNARILHNVGSGNAKAPRRILALTRGQMQFWRKHGRGPMAAVMRLLIWSHAAVRWLGSYPLKPLIGRERALSLRAAFGPICRRPGQWWNGWAGATLDG